MMKLSAALAVPLALSACGTSDPLADSPARSEQYYKDHPEDSAKMLVICRQIRESGKPVETTPSVVVSNCRQAGAASMAKSREAADRYFRGEK
jgi:hypothetical protein